MANTVPRFSSGGDGFAGGLIAGPGLSQSLTDNYIGRGLAATPDGSLISVGALNGDFAVIQYIGDGSQDASFGIKGFVTTDINGKDNRALDVAVQADGKIVVVGYVDNGGVAGKDLAIVRYNPDGTLDTTFGGGDGIVTLDYNSSDNIATAVAIRPSDQKIVVLGSGANFTDTDVTVTTLNPDGSVAATRLIGTTAGAAETGYDLAFQSDGDVVIAAKSVAVGGTTTGIVFIYNPTTDTVQNVNIGVGIPRALTVLPDDRILVGGDATGFGFPASFGLRLTPAGGSDTTFTTISRAGTFADIETAPNGTVYFAVDTASSETVFQYKSDGTNIGNVDIPTTGFKSETESILYQPAYGRLVISNSLLSTQGYLFHRLIGFNGFADTSFGGASSVDTSQAYVENDAPIILDSSVEIFDKELAALNDYGGSTLVLKRGFGVNPDDRFSSTLAVGNSIVLNGHAVATIDSSQVGQIKLTFAAGTTQAEVNAVLSSMTFANVSENPSAAPFSINWYFSDPEGATGKAATSIFIHPVNDPPTGAPTAVLANGKEDKGYVVSEADLLKGFSDPEGGLHVVNLKASHGSVTNDGNGNFTITPEVNFSGRMTLTYDVQDTVNDPIFETPFTLAGQTREYDVTPQNDAPSFLGNGSGISKLDLGAIERGSHVFYLPDNKILVVGFSDGKITVSRFNNDGTLDTNFGSGGTGTVTTSTSLLGSVTDIKSVSIEPDGRILIGGTLFNGNNGDVFVARLNADGSADTTWNNVGYNSLDLIPFGSEDKFIGLYELSDGSILVGGVSTPSGGSPSVQLRKFLSSGVYDTSFKAGFSLTALGGTAPDLRKMVYAPALNALGFAGGDGASIALAVASLTGELKQHFIVPVPGATAASVEELSSSGAEVGTTGKDLLIVTTDNVVIDAGSDDETLVTGEVLADGSTVAAGSSGGDLVIVRILADNTLDKSFGGKGWVKVDLGSASDTAVNLTVQPDGKYLVTGAGGGDTVLLRFNTDGSLDTTFSPTTTIDAAPSYSLLGPAVVLDSSVSVSDPELDTTGYAGATLELVRKGGANADDLFNATGIASNLEEGSTLFVEQIAIGAVTQNSGGRLLVTFGVGATKALVEKFLSAVTYANASNGGSGVDIAWTFSDGNTGAQGRGGALTAKGLTHVTFTPFAGHAPKGADKTVTLLEDANYTFNASVFGFTDADAGDVLTKVRIDTLPLAGTLKLGNVTVQRGQEISTASLSSLVFQPAANENGAGYASFTFSVSDGTYYSDHRNTLTFDVTPVNDAPTAVAFANSITSLPENTSTAAHIKLADIDVTDVDGGANALSLTGPDALNFEIVGNALYLKAAVALDFETKSSYAVTVNVDDASVGATPDAAANFVLNVKDVNEAPTAIRLSDTVTSIAENTSTAAHIKIANITIADDALGNNALSLSGIDASKFEIVGQSLYLKALTTLDFETKSSFAVTVNVDDPAVGGTPDATTNFVLKVDDVNEAPTAVTLNNKTAAIAETPSATKTKVADIVVTDDALGTNGLSLTGADAKLFEIAGSALYITAGAPIDYETKTKLSVTVNVDDKSVGGTPDASTVFEIAVTNVNEAPTGAPTAVLINGTEDKTYTIAIADLLKGFSDPEGDTVSVANLKATHGSVVLDGKGSGTYTFTPDADYNGLVTLTYDVTDGQLSLTGQQRTFSLTPVDDLPTAVVLSNIHAPLPEDTSTAAAIKIADIAVTDIDGGDNALSLTGIDAGMFSIVGSALYLKAGELLDFETNPVLDVTVNVDAKSNGAGVDASKSLAFQILDVAETITGTPKADKLFGNPWGEIIDGLAGNDIIDGGGGDDTIIGGLGRDIMTGGAGRDTFKFGALDSAPGASGYINNGPLNQLSGATTRDVITDFTPGTDLIDLSAIDAVSSIAGDQAFNFKATGNFTAAGDLIYRQFDAPGTVNDKTIIYGDTNGDRRADFQIELTGLKRLTASDFRL